MTVVSELESWIKTKLEAQPNDGWMQSQVLRLARKERLEVESVAKVLDSMVAKGTVEQKTNSGFTLVRLKPESHTKGKKRGSTE